MSCGDDGGGADADGGSSDGGACEGEQLECGDNCIDPIEPRLSTLQSSLFVTCNISNCHGTGPAEMLSMTDAATSHASLVGVASRQRPQLQLVEPGSPETSYLINKLRGVEIAETSSDGLIPGQIMPVGAPFCDARIEAIEQWIRDGAQNN